VAVTITIGEDGTSFLRKRRADQNLCTERQKRLLTKARFKPTTKDGKPVKVAAVISYNFVADKK